VERGTREVGAKLVICLKENVKKEEKKEKEKEKKKKKKEKKEQKAWHTYPLFPAVQIDPESYSGNLAVAGHPFLC
jgi:hypothetical protein